MHCSHLLRLLVLHMRSDSSAQRLKTRLNKYMQFLRSGSDAFRMIQLASVSMVAVVRCDGGAAANDGSETVFMFIAHYGAARRRQVVNHKYCAAPNGVCVFPFASYSNISALYGGGISLRVCVRSRACIK